MCRQRSEPGGGSGWTIRGDDEEEDEATQFTPEEREEIMRMRDQRDLYNRYKQRCANCLWPRGNQTRNFC